MGLLCSLFVSLVLVGLISLHIEAVMYDGALTVATYNVWNVMFNWEVRKFRIAQMIKDSNPDIIGFQEVRAHKDGLGNQILELQQLLPQYKWQVFELAHEVMPVKDSYIKGYEMEGIGLLSKFPIVRSTAQTLTYRSGPDTNHRVVLHSDIQVAQYIIHISVLHLSYDRMQQCNNVAEVLKYLHERQSLTDIIILGDFNTYKDFEWPVSLLLEHDMESKCSHYIKAMGTRQHFFLDSWKIVHPETPGLTFSNMPEPGMESRPDRILVSTSFHVTAGLLQGEGTAYKQRFSIHLLWARLQNVLGTAYDAWAGKTGRSCWHDCGPHSSCRCGVCISGGDTNFCLLPDCAECGPEVFFRFLVFVVVFVLLVAQLIYALLKFFQTMNQRGHHFDIPKHFGLNCCIFDKRLYTRMTPSSRRTKCHCLLQVWPVLRLPPGILLLVTVLLFILLGEVAWYAFLDAMADVYAIIPEELYPSDHLLLTVKLKKTHLL